MRVSIRDYTDSRFEALDTRLAEQHRAYWEAIRKAEDALDTVLAGFPQEYAKSAELKELRKALDDIKADHVQRRELEAQVTQIAGVKSFQNKTIGIVMFVIILLPIITAFATYLLTRHAVPIQAPPPGG